MFPIKAIAAVTFLLVVACNSTARPDRRASHGAVVPSAGVTPAPEASTAAAPAAPPPDADGDGVSDDCDHCPRSPGIDDVRHPHGRGCPHIDAFADSGEVLRGPIEFRAGEATLDAATKKRLRAIGEQLRSLEHVRFFVVGHMSDDERDPRLGVARAAAVAAELERAGLDAAKLEQRDAGTAHPIGTAGGAVDRGKSRRVELDLSRNHARERAWDEARRSVEYVQPGELASCPAALRR
jgi:outer membrane protein OmpA-like peptidoglycan-associated protein